MRAAVLFTCYNRKKKTNNCIIKLVELNPEISFSFVIADDNSNDGTYEMLVEMQKEYDIDIIRGDGKRMCDAVYSYFDW